jgi:regulator of replication initiation timing
MKVPPAQVAALIKIVSPNAFEQIKTIQHQTVTTSNNLTDFETEPTSLLTERKQKLRKEINRLANRLANMQNQKFEDIHKKWITEKGGNPNKNATFEELQQKFDWLKSEIIRIQQKRRS